MDFPALSTIFNAPNFIKGSNSFHINQMIRYGTDLRDNLVWQYPILPGALMTYQQIASSREIKVSGPTAIAVSRAIDWLNESVCYNMDGSIDVGFPTIVKRRVMDYLCVGRTIYYLGNGELEYLDPANMRWVFNDTRPYWLHSYTGKRYFPEELIINHPYPLGSSGWFLSPIIPIIPKAILAWLLDEHDRASADGRKIRDIIIAGSKELADTLAVAMQQSIALWAGADVARNGIPLAYLQSMPPSGAVQDMIGRVGLAEIPENFDRATFEFGYVNVIAANLRLALRHFWNSERATNRALEDMQEARQLQKGPNEFIRTEQRLINAHPMGIKQFGLKTRMGFIEEADVQTKQSNATVLKAYSDALLTFAKVFNGTVNGDAFLAWLQSEDILPADLELVADLGTMLNPDQQPITEGNPAQPMQKPANALTSGSSSKEKSTDILQYGEISMDLNGRILERRLKPFSVAEMVKKEIEEDPEYSKSLTSPSFEFLTLLAEAQRSNYEKFMEKYSGDLLPSYEELTSDQHHAIAEALNEDN